jgi:hypothetical protein
LQTHIQIDDSATRVAAVTQQQQQALQDALINCTDLADLAHGLSITLGHAYTARAHYIDQTKYTDIFS